MTIPRDSIVRLCAAGLLCAAAVLWVGCLLATPSLAGDGTPSAVASVTTRLGALICHQQAERSLRVSGAPLPVCARCFGLYAGAALGAGLSLAWLLAGRVRGRGRRAALPAVRLAIVVSALPTALLWLGEYGLSLSVSGPLRAWGAVPLGVTVAWLAGAAAGGARFTDAWDSAPEVH